MRLPARLTPHHPLRKFAASVVIAVSVTLIAFMAHHLPGVSVAMAALDNTLYDAFYHFRASEDRSDGPVVIVTVDESSLEKMNDVGFEWPWPRTMWAATVQYMQACGAKVLTFDVQFKDKRFFDKEFGLALDRAKIPVVLATSARPDGTPDAFSPKVTRPMLFGATNILDDKVARGYRTNVNGLPSLAARTVEASGMRRQPVAGPSFLLHYFGPHQWPDGRTTYRQIPAFRVCKAATLPNKAADVGITPDMFRDKIVLIGGTALGTFDLKSSPLSPIYPGVEIHATAIDDLLTGRIVHPTSPLASAALAGLASFLAALGVLFPRRVWLKLALAFLAFALLIGGAVSLFTGHTIHWLPMASPLVALLVATVGAFAWSYLTEDRQRKLVLKALSQYVSPHVASEIERNPGTLKLGGQRRDMTVMFSDIQGFTDLSESMESEKLSDMLNFYLGEMSGLILANNGTLDKYIGDAIMCFWNAPVMQPDHAILACRAALAMQRREAEIQDALAAFGAKGMLTRIGINTGAMIFGNMGAPQKFNYSVLGDSVNLGSRLEGANKFYGSRILIAESTALLVKNTFVLRQLDLLRVKGKQKPLAVYELLGEGQPDSESRDRVTQYEQAFGLYQARKWDDGESLLNILHERFPHDLPVAALLKRIHALRDDPPPPDWDGVYVAKDK